MYSFFHSNQAKNPRLLSLLEFIKLEPKSKQHKTAFPFNRFSKCFFAATKRAPGSLRKWVDLAESKKETALISGGDTKFMAIKFV
jgi:hypothetical protein